MLRIVALGLCLVGLVEPALAETCHGVQMPPKAQRQEPAVHYDVFWISGAEMHRRVNAVPSPSGIAVPNPTKAHPDGWVIFLNSDKIGLDDLACLLTYEKSHLPPNNYNDPPEVQALFKPYR